MSKNKGNKYSKAFRILALICILLLSAAMTVPLWVGK